MYEISIMKEASCGGISYEQGFSAFGLCFCLLSVVAGGVCRDGLDRRWQRTGGKLYHKSALQNISCTVIPTCKRFLYSYLC